MENLIPPYVENGHTLLVYMSMAAAQFSSQDENIKYLLFKEYLRVDREMLARYKASGSPLARFYHCHMRDTFGNLGDSRESMYKMIIDLVKGKDYTIRVDFERRSFKAPLARAIYVTIGKKTYKTTLRAKSIKLIKE